MIRSPKSVTSSGAPALVTFFVETSLGLPPTPSSTKETIRVFPRGCGKTCRLCVLSEQTRRLMSRHIRKTDCGQNRLYGANSISGNAS